MDGGLLWWVAMGHGGLLFLELGRVGGNPFLLHEGEELVRYLGQSLPRLGIGKDSEGKGRQRGKGEGEGGGLPERSWPRPDSEIV